MHLKPKKEIVLSREDALFLIERYHDGTLSQELEGFTQNEQAKILYDMGFHDEEFFAQFFCTRWVTDELKGIILDSPAFHKEGWRAISEGQDLLMLVARDHGKTTGYSRIKTTHTLLYYHASIILVAEKGLGEKIIGSIREVLEESEEIRMVFGNIVPINNRKEDKTSKWRQRELQLSDGSEIKSLTRGQAVRGNRPNIILIDDPQGEKDVKNPQIALEFYDWVWTALYNMLEDGGQMIVLGTIFDEMCFVSILEREAEQRDFRVIKQSALVDYEEGDIWSGRPLWPEKWSKEALKKRMKKIQEAPFMQEYMHIPMKSTSNRVFKNCAKLVQNQQIETLVWTSGDVQSYKSEVKIFSKEPKQQLFIGLDFFDGGKDWNAMVVRDEGMRLIATVHNQLRQEKMADILDFVLDYFGMSEFLIAPEVNMGQNFMMVAREKEWWGNIMRREVVDSTTRQKVKKAGFRMTETSKRLVVGTYARVMEDEGLEVSKELQSEIETFVTDHKGRMGAKSPHHDDLLVADLLSIHAHSQRHNVSSGFSFGSV